MFKHGTKMNEYLEFLKFDISRKSICTLMKKVLTFLEDIHNRGYVYNDIDLNNIVFSKRENMPLAVKNYDIFENSTFYLGYYDHVTAYMMDEINF